MTCGDLPDDAHIVRYISPSRVDENGVVNGKAFRLRPNENGLSVNWLDFFADLGKSEQLNEVRRLSRLELRSNGRFAELNVGVAKQAVRAELPNLRFIHDPLPAVDEYDADPSHSQIAELPPLSDSQRSAMIGDMIARCVLNLYPAAA